MAGIAAQYTNVLEKEIKKLAHGDLGDEGAAGLLSRPGTTP